MKFMNNINPNFMSLVVFKQNYTRKYNNIISARYSHHKEPTYLILTNK